jgi:hypothetical protein
MNSISNQLQSTLQTLYSQLGSHDPLEKFGSASNVLHSHGLTPGLLQDLRHDLDGVVNGKNPDRIVQNLLEGLKKFLTSTHSASEKMATGVNASEYKAPMSFVMGEDGKAKQLDKGEKMPTGVNSSEYKAPMSFVMGEDGKAKQLDEGEKMPTGVNSSEYKAPMSFVMGEDGKVKQLDEGEKMPTGVNSSEYKAPISFVMGEDGKVKQLPSSEVPFGVNKESNLPLDTATDHVVSDLKALLDAEAAGNDISSSLINLRSSLKQLLDNPALTNDPELLRNALRKSIEAQA